MRSLFRALAALLLAALLILCFTPRAFSAPAGQPSNSAEQLLYDAVNRERAALAWTEALTLITDGHAPDEVYAEVRKEFGEEELVNLSLAIISVNGWNRLAIGFRTIPGEYQPS